MSTQVDRMIFLRRSLQFDGIASGLCGMILIAAAQPISAFSGLGAPCIALAVGVLLLVYAGALLWNAGRARISRG
ncbi:MAG: hypothetical protein ACT4PY_10600 [Armatimonadota bacterium]